MSPIWAWTVALLAIAVVSVASGGCAPAQQIIMRQKVIERNAPPRPGVERDNFLHNRAMGSVDILFVVDNTESFETALSTFRTSYEAFLDLLETDEGASLLDYRVQVVTTPYGSSTKNYVAPGVLRTLQINDLFTSANPILSLFESGMMDPLTSTVVGLSNKAFENRSFTPLFIVYLLGDDMAEQEEGVAQALADQAEEELEKSRGMHQVHSYTVLRNSEETFSTPFPDCEYAHLAPRVLSSMAYVDWASSYHQDLCDNTWTSFSQTLFDQIIAFKKRLVLSRVPNEPETMMLRTANHLYRYNQDYTLNFETNEIEWLISDSGLSDGDPLEAVYYLEVEDEVIPDSEDLGPSPDADDGDDTDDFDEFEEESEEE